jgi:hypothetical protein
MRRNFLIFVFLIISILSVSAQKARNHPAILENYNCLRCHGQSVYTSFSMDAKQHMNQPMAESRVIPSMKYQNAIHGSLKCIDCHAEGYSNTPHPVDLKFEPLYTCTDCHEGQKKFKKYHLDSIQTGYEKSIHAKAMHNTFNCWKCHNAHTYFTTFSEGADLKSAITSSNSTCLDCHNNAVNYKRVSVKTQKDVLKSHEWLKYPELHLKNIRCVDCHAKLTTSTFTPHEILPAEKAIRECTACHSQKSILSHSLLRTKKGNESFLNFTNNKALEYAFIMGANRSITLTIISTVLFIIVLLIIFIHLIFLKHYRKLHKNG